MFLFSANRETPLIPGGRFDWLCDLPNLINVDQLERDKIYPGVTTVSSHVSSLVGEPRWAASRCDARGFKGLALVVCCECAVLCCVRLCLCLNFIFLFYCTYLYLFSVMHICFCFHILHFAFLYMCYALCMRACCLIVRCVQKITPQQSLSSTVPP